MHGENGLLFARANLSADCCRLSVEGVLCLIWLSGGVRGDPWSLLVISGDGGLSSLGSSTGVCGPRGDFFAGGGDLSLRFSIGSGEPFLPLSGDL